LLVQCVLVGSSTTDDRSETLANQTLRIRYDDGGDADRGHTEATTKILSISGTSSQFANLGKFK